MSTCIAKASPVSLTRLHASAFRAEKYPTPIPANDPSYQSLLSTRLDEQSGQPLLCYHDEHWACVFARSFYPQDGAHALSDWLRFCLTAQLGTSNAMCQTQWLIGAVEKARTHQRHTVPAYGVSSYHGNGVAMLLPDGPWCVTPEQGWHRPACLLTPFYAPECLSHDRVIDPLAGLLTETQPYAEEALRILPLLPLEHPTHPELMRWLVACSYAAGESPSFWCSRAREVLTASMRR